VTRVKTPLRNNARLILLVTLVALAVLLALELLLRQSRDFAPDFLASVFLYALTVLNLTLLLVLLFVLGRSVVKVLMERRRGVLGARFRMRLLLVFLLMAIAPSVLLVLVGGDLIQQTVDRWFSQDAERILSSSQALGVALRQAYGERSRRGATLLAAELQTRRMLEPEGQGRLRRAVERRRRELGLDVVDVFNREGELLAVVDPRLPNAPPGAMSADALAESVLATEAGHEVEASTPFGGGELVRVGLPVRDSAGRCIGAVVASSYLPAEILAESREVQERYLKFRKAQTLRGPIKGVYFAIYALAGLLVLYGAVWLALYLARHITTPLRLVSEGAERIATGERGVRVDFPTGSDEFTALIASFNRMSERLQRSEEEIDQNRQGLARKNRELEERQRLIETVIEAVGAGVVVLDADGRVTATNPAAQRLLAVTAEQVGQPVQEVLAGPERAEILDVVLRLLAGRGSRQEREVRLPAPGRQRTLGLTGVALADAGAGPAGALLVIDDLTPLMRAQKVAAWGEVARKLAHEIKNPLTPIQLSAQRIRKASLRRAADLDLVIDEGTQAIVQEVEALKNLVDEFAQFARLPAANLALTPLHDVVEQALSLYEGLFVDVQLERRFAPELPPLRLDADQIKRALINLVDNAIEAMERKGTITIATEYDPQASLVRLRIVDQGPGVPLQDRERLFEPHFSTKKRGSGLGLAIVSRIVQEHHGSIRVEEHAPRGAVFIIELPV
jgi:two-component system, NtrC family, nitrogen regulation sensor histidine kinase NtrY